MPSTAQRPKAKAPKKARKKTKVVRKRKVIAKPVVEVPRLVGYYLDGWRYGYREGTKGVLIIIQPIGALGSPPPRKIRVSAEDVREI